MKKSQRNPFDLGNPGPDYRQSYDHDWFSGTGMLTQASHRDGNASQSFKAQMGWSGTGVAGPIDVSCLSRSPKPETSMLQAICMSGG